MSLLDDRATGELTKRGVPQLGPATGDTGAFDDQCVKAYSRSLGSCAVPVFGIFHHLTIEREDGWTVPELRTVGCRTARADHELRTGASRETEALVAIVFPLNVNPSAK